MSAGRPTERIHRPAAALSLGLLLICLGAGPVAAAPSASKAQEVFGRFEKAWSRGQANKVTAEMASRGRLRVQLRDPTRVGRYISGNFRAAQDETTLASYFKKVPARRLKTRKPKKAPAEKSGYRTRYYDHTYRPKGKSHRTATLVVQLKAEGKRWVLVSITERGRT